MRSQSTFRKGILSTQAFPVVDACLGSLSAEEIDRSADFAGIARAVLFSMATMAITSPAITRIVPVTAADAAPISPSPVQNPPRRLVQEEFAAADEELVSYKGLRNGWDGPDSIAPSRGTIEGARAHLVLFALAGIRAPDVSTSADGDIDLYWKTPSGFIDINYRPNGTIAYHAKVSGRVIAQDIAPFEQRSLPQQLLDALKLV